MILDLIGLCKKHNMKIKGVIHIGSHHGQENAIYNSIDIKNRIFFEPLDSNFSILEKIEFLSVYGFELVEQNWIGGTWGDGLFVKNTNGL